MSRTIQVIIAIAIVCCAVEICALAASFFEAPELRPEPYVLNAIERAELRWKIYWFSGAPIAVLGLFIKRRNESLGMVIFITGTYLMLFGNNGGFWSDGYIFPRMITSFITLIGLLILIKNERWSKDI